MTIYISSVYVCACPFCRCTSMEWHKQDINNGNWTGEWLRQGEILFSYSPHIYSNLPLMQRVTWSVCHVRKLARALNWPHRSSSIYTAERKEVALHNMSYLIIQSVRRRASGWTTPVRFPVWERFLCNPQRPDRLWIPNSLLSNGYRNSFPGGKVAWAWS